MISLEQAKQIKEQLLSQIENFPEDKRETAKSQIETMNSQELEQFLIQNKLIKGPGQETAQEQAVFRLIVEEKIPSFKIDENKQAIAILEINPISKGHSMILLKEPVISTDKIPSQAFSLAKKIAKKIKTKFQV